MRIPFFKTGLTAAQVSPLAGALQAAPKYYAALQTANVAHQNLLQKQQATAQALQKTLQSKQGTAQALQKTSQEQIATQELLNDLYYQRKFLHNSFLQQVAKTTIAGAKATVAPKVQGALATSDVANSTSAQAAAAQAAKQQAAKTAIETGIGLKDMAKGDYAGAIAKQSAAQAAQKTQQAEITTKFMPRQQAANITATTMHGLGPLLNHWAYLASNPTLLTETAAQTQAGLTPYGYRQSSPSFLSNYAQLHEQELGNKASGLISGLAGSGTIAPNPQVASPQMGSAPFKNPNLVTLDDGTVGVKAPSGAILKPIGNGQYEVAGYWK